ncbi:hypothetical protein [Vineibacter terrae]|uniref:hypothetical protein n=1 Tax=Vineibacter terrae TaxID=2586908 RepID=UPI002E364551|nr:hypothetical protein [Vineibacter terrae]HEX2886086.1 hypothetical protein [Vineibacter terrae]
MGHRFQWAAVIAAAVAVSGCATDLGEAGARVMIVGPDEVAGYEYLGPVAGSSMQAGVMAVQGFHNALNEMLDEAGAKGATHVVLTFNPGPVYWTWHQRVRGDAYKARP